MNMFCISCKLVMLIILYLHMSLRDKFPNKCIVKKDPFTKRGGSVSAPRYPNSRDPGPEACVGPGQNPHWQGPEDRKQLVSKAFPARSSCVVLQVQDIINVEEESLAHLQNDLTRKMKWIDNDYLQCSQESLLHEAEALLQNQHGKPNRKERGTEMVELKLSTPGLVLFHFRWGTVEAH